MIKPVRVGLIGCGNISDAYLRASKTFKVLEIVACADINAAAAKAKAEQYGIEAVSVDKLLSDDRIEAVLNLTTPQAHTEVNLNVIRAGKHVHCEKPLAVERADGERVVKEAKDRGVMVGCAPDTFLGGAHQTCRKLIDDGVIGRPVAGTAFMMCHGHESWHPNPGFYYLKGGGPMLDMGPYYLTALVNMLGPVRRVCGSTAVTFKERTATCKERAGEKLPVEVATHVAGTLDFRDGAVITMVTSFDVWRATNHCIEIHGELGSLQVPDPNGFGGTVRLYKPGMQNWEEVPIIFGYTDNMRSIGLADMAYAIRSGRKNRCSGDLAYHVLDVMHSFQDSSDSDRHALLKSTCERPKALPLNLQKGELDK